VKDWSMLPTQWVRNNELHHFRWKGNAGPAGVAALIVLIVLSHSTDDEGISRQTYDEICKKANLSRGLASAGLKKLESLQLIKRERVPRSTTMILNYGKTPFGKLPAKGLYSNGCIDAFSFFSLRKRVELDALKLYLLVVAFRDDAQNVTRISYDKITERTGIERARIKAAVSFLISVNMLHLEREESSNNNYASANIYRLAHLYSYRHMGTLGRSGLFEGLDDADQA